MTKKLISAEIFEGVASGGGEDMAARIEELNLVKATLIEAFPPGSDPEDIPDVDTAIGVVSAVLSNIKEESNKDRGDLYRKSAGRLFQMMSGDKQYGPMERTNFIDFAVNCHEFCIGNNVSFEGDYDVGGSDYSGQEETNLPVPDVFN